MFTYELRWQFYHWFALICLSAPQEIHLCLCQVLVLHQLFRLQTICQLRLMDHFQNYIKSKPKNFLYNHLAFSDAEAGIIRLLDFLYVLKGPRRILLLLFSISRCATLQHCTLFQFLITTWLNPSIVFNVKTGNFYVHNFLEYFQVIKFNSLLTNVTLVSLEVSQYQCQFTMARKH